jgi:predicted ATPase
MLEQFAVAGFKSYKEAVLKLAPLTVLIGANASGKSNAIEALRLLAWIAQGNRLGAIRYQVYEGEEAVRGSVANLGFHGRGQFTFSCRTSHDDWEQYSVSLKIGADEDLHIADERILSPNTAVPLYQVVGDWEEAGTDLRVAYNNFARGGRKPQVTCSDQMAILQQLQSSARFEAGHTMAQRKIPEVCRYYQQILSGIIFLDPSPTEMRDYSFKKQNKLTSNGSNISGVLFGLCRDPEKQSEIIDVIKSLPEQDIEGIDFIETPRDEVMLALSETFGGQTNAFDATLLSDGTLRVLAIAAAILTAPEGSLVVIEEIDNGIHPSRAHSILERISRIAKQRGLRVLISSHNPALLDALPDDAVPDIVFCYRDVADGSSRLVRLEEIPDYPELLAQGSVGHLMTHGLIDRFAKHPRTADERSRKFHDWLDTLERRTG